MYRIYSDRKMNDMTKECFARNCSEQVKFYGCRHVLLEEYDIIREELIKREYKLFSKQQRVLL